MKHTSLVIGLALVAGGALHAQIYQYGIGDADNDSVLDSIGKAYNSNGGYVNSLFTEYNAGTGRFDFSVDFASKGGNRADSFWIVVNDGPNPKGNAEELAIFYFDGTDVAGGGDAIVTSYVYSGANSSLSFVNPGETLYSSLNGDPITATGSIAGDIAAFSFSVDTTGLNDPTQWPASYGLGADWKGAQFNDEIGIWFHPVVTSGSGPAYGGPGSGKEGFLTSFPVATQGWIDMSHQPTVPEPSASLLAAIGGMGLLARRRRK